MESNALSQLGFRVRSTGFSRKQPHKCDTTSLIFLGVAKHEWAPSLKHASAILIYCVGLIQITQLKLLANIVAVFRWIGDNAASIRNRTVPQTTSRGGDWIQPERSWHDEPSQDRSYFVVVRVGNGSRPGQRVVQWLSAGPSCTLIASIHNRYSSRCSRRIAC
jgi:hypothetical protein